MKKHLLIAIASALVLSVPGITKAQFDISVQVGGIPTVSGATLETFNEPSPLILSLSGPAYLLTGTHTEGTAPFYSGSTAAFFGESPAYGYDNSQYVSLGYGGTATLSFSTPQNYFGLLWASVDTMNLLTFYDGAYNVIGTVSAYDLPGISIPSGTGVGGTFYVNINSTIAFSTVIASNPDDAFEFDDVAYAMTVPEPVSGVLFGVGLCILGFRVIRRQLGLNCCRTLPVDPHALIQP